jgi:hypothetical protein
MTSESPDGPDRRDAMAAIAVHGCPWPKEDGSGVWYLVVCEIGK